MGLISLGYGTLAFYAFLVLCIVLYYCFPLKLRWTVLLAASCFFYYSVSASLFQLLVFASTIALSYGFSLLMERIAAKGAEKQGRKDKALLIAASVISALPLLLSRFEGYFTASLSDSAAGTLQLLIPVGLAFYSMQMISYLADIYRGRIKAVRNPLKYILFISFFPHIIQGPIPRYEQLGEQLLAGHRYDPENTMQGIRLTMWGFFLKLMIADKAGVIVDAVFDQYEIYSGGFILLAAVLYSVQLYADFQACVKMSQGMARFFGIRLEENFTRPYFAASVKEFWGRWHRTLSGWLRDYIYIPLGGSRKGKARRYLNLLVTFAVSGLWHGAGVHFLIWGILNALYIIAEDIAAPLRKKLSRSAGIIITFILITIAWVFFRAPDTASALLMLKEVVTDPAPWIFTNDSIFWLIMDQKECIMLVLSVCLLFAVSLAQERGRSVSAKIAGLKLPARWAVYLFTIWILWIYGSYGSGFQAGDFIYGGF